MGTFLTITYNLGLEYSNTSIDYVQLVQQDAINQMSLYSPLALWMYEVSKLSYLQQIGSIKHFKLALMA